MPEMRFLIHPDGTVTVDAVGFTGDGCLKATRPYEESLGGHVAQRQAKPEAGQAVHQAARTPLEQREGGQ